MASIVPDAVLLRNSHVAHLNGQEIFDDRLPNTTLVDIICYAEYTRLCRGIAHLIETSLGDITQVGREITIAQEIAPHLGLDCTNNSLAVGIDANHLQRLDAVVALIGLYHDVLLLLGLIAYLRGLDHWLVAPLAIHLGSNQPSYGPLRGTLGNLASQYEPAVVMVHAPVV